MQDASETLGHRQVLAIALPIIFSNVTTPLIGVVDTAVMGRLGPPELIGARGPQLHYFWRRVLGVRLSPDEHDGADRPGLRRRKARRGRRRAGSRPG